MWQYFFQIPTSKYPIKAFLIKNNKIRFFCLKLSHFFCEIFQLDKFEGVDFKYDKIVFKW